MSHTIRPRRILLVEDNAANQKVMTAILTKANFEVDVAWNGVEGLKAVRSKPYDLILMDIQMPEMDGLEATRRIRAMEGNIARIPIVAVTAIAMRGTRERCMEAGMHDFVPKPVSVRDLIEKAVYWSTPQECRLASADHEAKDGGHDPAPTAARRADDESAMPVDSDGDAKALLDSLAAISLKG